MTPAHQAALEALAGRVLTPAEIALGDARNDANLADSISVGRVKTVGMQVTERAIMSTLGVVAGEQLLSALESFVANPLPAGHPLLPAQPGIRRMLGWLKTDGLDCGSVAFLAMLNALSQAGVIDATSAQAIALLSQRPDPVPWSAIADILNGA